MTTRPATTFLRLALRRATRGTGSSTQWLDHRTAMQPVPDIGQILGPIPWVLVGGLALRAYMPERMTLDVDILVHERDAIAARDALAAAGYRVTDTLSIGGFSVQSANTSEPPIDVLTRADAWLDDALAQPTHDAAGYPVLGRPYLMLLKLQSGRTQDLADVQRMLARTSVEERNAIRLLVGRISPELLEDHDALVTLADLEFGPPPSES